MTITLITEEGDEIALPTIKEVCYHCHGKGTHVNPSIDGNGITSEEMSELGDDFREDYLNGVYDIPCEVCGGENVIDVVDEKRCDPELLALYRKQEEDEAEYQYIAAAERRIGA